MPDATSPERDGGVHAEEPGEEAARVGGRSVTSVRVRTRPFAPLPQATTPRDEDTSKAAARALRDMVRTCPHHEAPSLTTPPSQPLGGPGGRAPWSVLVERVASFQTARGSRVSMEVPPAHKLRTPAPSKGVPLTALVCIPRAFPIV